MIKILMIEDDTELAEILSEYLSKNKIIKTDICKFLPFRSSIFIKFVVEYIC